MYRYARTPNSRNGRSEAYLPYSMPLMDGDEGARTGLSSRRAWRGTGLGGGGKGSRAPATSVVGSAFTAPAPAEEMHDGRTDLSELECRWELGSTTTGILKTAPLAVSSPVP
jgi:hypothetical protein